MILTETGHHFRRDREAGGWRCIEHPDLLLLPGGVYVVGRRRFDDLREALRHVERATIPPRDAPR